MPKGSKFSEFERGRIVKLHKQGLSQRAIAEEIHISKIVICIFIKNPESYGTAKSSDRPRKLSPAMSTKIIRVVSQGRGRSTKQIQAFTDANCSPITIR